MNTSYAISRSEIRIALHRLGVSKKAKITFAPISYNSRCTSDIDRIKVIVDGEYFGIWDANGKTFVD